MRKSAFELSVSVATATQPDEFLLLHFLVSITDTVASKPLAT